MSIRRAEDAPWPRQTQPPDLPTRSLKRRKIELSRAAEDPVQSAETQCDFLSGNDVESCFPSSDSVFVQAEFVTFVWNSRLPSYAQTNKVNVYLYHGDSNEQIFAETNIDNSNNQAGVVSFQVNDSWWGSNGPNYSGSNTTYPFYFGITPNTTTFDASAHTQTHFSVIQTTFPNSVLASISSASSASSLSAVSASRASASASASSASASAAAASSSASPSSSSGGASGSLHPDNNSSGFPHWAIAVIVVLGFLAIASSCLLAFFIMRRLRRRRELESNRNSMGSASPMMAHVQSPGSPLLASGTGGGGGGSLGHGAAGAAGAASVVSPDGASSISHGGSAHGGEGGPFSGADAAIIANAFRTMLRKPDFADAPVEEGESPDSQERGRVELNRELAEEGRDIRSVSSSRGVRVETLSDDDGDTVSGH